VILEVAQHGSGLGAVNRVSQRRHEISQTLDALVVATTPTQRVAVDRRGTHAAVAPWLTHDIA
jgi:hypothetical protein